MQRIWQNSRAIYPSIYLSAAPNNHSARRHRVSSIVSLGAATAKLVANAGRRRLPVYPFAWESYHNGSTLLTRDDAITELLSPYNSGADGLVIWGSTRTHGSTGLPIFPAQGGANTSRYFEYVEKTTGPLIARFERRVAACSIAECSGHGRCTTVKLESHTQSANNHDWGSQRPACSCFDGFSGTRCEIPLSQPREMPT